MVTILETKLTSQDPQQAQTPIDTIAGLLHTQHIGQAKEIQCGATPGHALACISPSRVRPPVMCAYAIREFS